MKRLRKLGGSWTLAEGGHRVRAPLAGRVIGQGPAVLFAHGLGSTHRIWGGAYDRLGAGYRMGFVDLAGFGESVEVKGPYSLSGHLERLREFRDSHLPAGPLVVVGYSFGGLLALAASGLWPDVVGTLSLAPPVFGSSEEARAHFSRLDPFHRWLASGHPSVRVAGKLVCRRPSSKRLLSALWPFHPAPVMHDVLELSIEALTESFRSLLDEQRVAEWVAMREVPRRIVQGERDRYCNALQLRRAVRGLPLEVKETPGTHYFPITDAQRCALHVEEFLGLVSGERLKSVA